MSAAFHVRVLLNYLRRQAAEWPRCVGGKLDDAETLLTLMLAYALASATVGPAANAEGRDASCPTRIGARGSGHWTKRYHEAR